MSTTSNVVQSALGAGRRAGWLVAVIAALGACKSGQGGGPGPRATPSRSTSLRNLQIYYGWPSAFDGATSPRLAAERLARYDAVVLGAGLEQTKHGDHANTKEIIAVIGERSRVFGYIPLGHKTGLTLSEIAGRVADWKAIGVVGIFFDEAGYEFCNTRARQNAAFDAAHRAGLEVFANGHDPNELFSAKPRALFNPKGLPTTLRRGDHYLYESFGLILGKLENPEERLAKLTKLAPARKLGVRLWGVTTVAADGPPDRGAWREVVKLARQAGLYGVGYGAYGYGAMTKRVPFMPIEQAR